MKTGTLIASYNAFSKEGVTIYQVFTKEGGEAELDSRLLDKLGINVALGQMSGAKVDIENGQIVDVHIKAASSVTALKGLVRKPASPVTIEDMNKAIDAHVDGEAG